VDGGVERPDAVCEGDCHDKPGGAVEHDGPDHCPWEHARCVTDLLSFRSVVSIRSLRSLEVAYTCVRRNRIRSMHRPVLSGPQDMIDQRKASRMRQRSSPKHQHLASVAQIPYVQW